MKRETREVWREINGDWERSCVKCNKWWSFNLDHWYIRKSGSKAGQPIGSECRHCRAPYGKPGRPVGSRDSYKRSRTGGLKALQAYEREKNMTFSGDAAVDACKRLGIDIAAIGASLADD